MICIIDYQSGNLGAIVNMLKKLGVTAQICSTPDQLKNATKVFLPGVGTFDTGMQNLISGGWLDILNQKVLIDKIPTMGICLGFQLMTHGSEEGKLEGLKWFNGVTKRFSFEKDRTFKIPHMGWNEVSITKATRLLTEEEGKPNRFYFAHGYYISLEDQREELLRTSYGFDFTSGAERENIVGVQFHPEKSHRFGLSLMRNFIANY